MAQQDLQSESSRLAGTRMLKWLMEVDKMRFSNVNFRNSLDYLALQWKR
jgi:DNA polymerase-3 subunit delta'